MTVNTKTTNFTATSPRLTLYITLSLLVLVLTGCDKIVPFEKQTFRTINDSVVITLLSPSELEMKKGELNVVCQYSQEGDRIRVIMNVMGMTQALYYQKSPQGLISENGERLFNAEEYKHQIAKVMAQRQQSHLDKALFEAARTGNAEAIAQLISRGGNVGAVNDAGYRPLHAAAARGRVSAVKVLLEAGADPNARTTGGDFATPLVSAMRTRFYDLGMELIQVSEEDNIATIKLLIQNGADINMATLSRGKSNITPLMEALDANNYAAARFLLAAGADTTLRNTAGNTVYDYADGNAEEMKLLNAKK